MKDFWLYFWRTAFILVVVALLSSGISSFFKPLHFISPSDAPENIPQQAKFGVFIVGIVQIAIALLIMRKAPKRDKIIILVLTVIATAVYLLLVIPSISAQVNSIYRKEIEASIVLPGMSKEEVVRAIGEPYQKKENYWWYPGRKFIYFKDDKVTKATFPFGEPKGEL